MSIQPHAPLHPSPGMVLPAGFEQTALELLRHAEEDFGWPCAGSARAGTEVADPVLGGRKRRLVHVEDYTDPVRIPGEVWTFGYDGSSWAALFAPCAGPCCVSRRAPADEVPP